MSDDAIPAGELVSEPDVLAKRPVLAASRLREARKAGRIEWTRGKRGSAWYRLADVDAFIDREMKQPRADAAATIASAKSEDPDRATVRALFGPSRSK